MKYVSLFTKALLILSFFVVCKAANAQITLVQNAVSSYQIVIPDKPTDIEKRSADELKSYISQTTKANLSITSEASAKTSQNFYIGNTKAARSIQAGNGIQNDGFAIRSKNKSIYILGIQGKGTLYGVHNFLERFFGVDYLSADIITIPNLSKVTIPVNTNIVSNPAFITRDNFTDMGYNGKWNGNEREYVGGYKDWHCINHVFLDWDKESAWGLFGHTFFKIVPPQTYFASHPEYYSLIDGKRQAQQLNLSNSELANVVIQNLKKMMQDNPNLKYWMVGQEDAGKWCECEDCQRANKKYGDRKSGLLIEFVNKIAKAFPDKMIATFAYTETQEPPKNIVPAANVIIVNAPMDAHHNAPLESSENNGPSSFIKQWKSIAKQQMIWDYYADFTEILAPYPNLSTMSPNFKWYYKMGIRHVFAQRPVFMAGSDMEELKAYVISKLLWNPFINQDSLVNSFANRYYGDAGKYIVQYLNVLTDNMKKTGAVLETQQDALTYLKTFLSPAYIKQYYQILDEAAKAANNQDILNRVNNVRFSLDYVTVKALKDNGRASLSLINDAQLNQIKERFKASAKRMNVKFTADASQRPIDPYLSVWNVNGTLLQKAAMASVVCFGGVGIVYARRKQQKKEKQKT